jgi:subtilisin-like proprotein convertase family protein
MKSKAPVWAFSIWYLARSLAEAGSTETNGFNVNLAIPDGKASGLSDVRVVSSSIPRLSNVRVQLEIAGEFNGDLYGYLRHITPGATNFCVLLNRPGRSSSNPLGHPDFGFNVLFDDAASNGDIHQYQTKMLPAPSSPLTGIWQPDGRNLNPFTVSEDDPRTTTLASFVGVPASGEWTLFLADLESGGTHFLRSWGIELSGIIQPALSWPNPPEIVYGTPLGPSELNASSPVPGTFTYDPPAGTVLDAGQGLVLSVTFTPDDLLSYSSVTTNVAINVAKKSLTITAVDVTRPYGAPAVSGVSFDGFVNDDTEADLDEPPVVGSDAALSSPVGVYPINVSGASDPNYSITFVPGHLRITPAATVGALVSSTNPAAIGAPVTFTFSVSSVPPAVVSPVGDVLFVVDGTSTSSVPLINGDATLSTTTLAAGLHVVTAEYRGNSNFFPTVITRLDPDQLVNTLPVASTDYVPRYLPAGAKVQIATLLRNDSDADGHPVSFVSVAAQSEQGGVVARYGDWISYTAPSGFTNDDAFSYAISDGYEQHIGTVSIVVQAEELPSPNLLVTDLGDGTYRIRFNGVPDLAYRVEYADSLNSPQWLDLGIIGEPNSVGQFELIDRLPERSTQRFYRSVYP